MNPILLKFGLSLLARKINDNPNDKQKSDFDRKAAKKVVPAWVAVAGFIVYLASSLGYIDKGLADAINALISNPEVVHAIDSAGE